MLTIYEHRTLNALQCLKPSVQAGKFIKPTSVLLMTGRAVHYTDIHRVMRSLTTYIYYVIMVEILIISVVNAKCRLARFLCWSLQACRKSQLISRGLIFVLFDEYFTTWRHHLCRSFELYCMNTAYFVSMVFSWIQELVNFDKSWQYKINYPQK